MTKYKPFIPHHRQPTVTLQLPHNAQIKKAATVGFVAISTLGLVLLVVWVKTTATPSESWTYGGADFEAFLESVDNTLPEHLPKEGE